ncbi:MAG TPA: HAD family hydrolase [Gemmatimonadaceae bacterium]|nr:HAD family hydrolase [Gemmatimonadaceae bacterium]
MLKALSLDYWDTLYDGSTLPERVARRRGAIHRMLGDVGCAIGEAEFAELYAASGREAERWWREEHRGYGTADRIRWILDRVGVERPADCEHVARAAAEVDETLLAYPPPLLAGAAAAVRALAEHFPLVIVSDTGFASGRAQDRLLERDGIARHFVTRVYSCDVGHAKPHRAPFERALRSLSLAPDELLHIGDIERTDVRGALGAGCRAIRLDVVRKSGPSAAELVAESFEEVVEYLVERA